MGGANPVNRPLGDRSYVALNAKYTVLIVRAGGAARRAPPLRAPGSPRDPAEHRSILICHLVGGRMRAPQSPHAPHRPNVPAIRSKSLVMADMNSEPDRRLGDELHQALIDRVPVSPLGERGHNLTVLDAYRIQQRFVAAGSPRRPNYRQEDQGDQPRRAADARRTSTRLRDASGRHALRCRNLPIPTDTLIQPRAEGKLPSS
ncbi:hypothetical protein ACU4GD_05530 [Cupriavidus basilensis]